MRVRPAAPCRSGITPARSSISAELWHLRAADRACSPWKNGGGATREVLAWPPGADLDSFDWRVSFAEVAADGPFSRFPGVDRTLAIVSGAGIQLDVGDHSYRLTSLSPPHRFPGDAASHARLLDGPVTDLNVMSRRGRLRHQVIRAEGQTERHCPVAAGMTLLLWTSPAGEVVTPAGRARLQPYDALATDAAGIWRFAAAQTAFLVTFAPSA